MAKSYNYDLTDEEYQLVYGSKRPVAEENKKQKVSPSLDLTEEELSFVYGADYGKSKEPASGGVGSSDAASAAPVQRREEQGLQPDRQVAPSFFPTAVRGGGDSLSPEVVAGGGVQKYAEGIPKVYRAKEDAYRFGKALDEFAETGTITLRKPGMGRVPIGGFGPTPGYDPGLVLRGEEAEAKLADLSNFMDDFRGEAQQFQEEIGPVGRAVVGLATQPTQALSVAGGMVL